MASKNNLISGGLNGLLKPAPASTPEAVQEPTGEPKTKGNYKTVCYSIPPELAEKMRYIAYWDRKKLNAVVVEAFSQYVESWKPSTGEKPKKL